ncbi:MAG: glyoxalase/bleomycin resistance/dioxygenase family protein [Fibrobacteres bacterium]|jgi:hypothetical protein|nr:glyoxalase/bleomycin resistance/dioxygenase family protein [Fibrobacterota bacterium]
MKFICTLVVVEDISKSRKLYETILNQKVLTDYGENIAFEGGFAIHKLDHFQGLICNKVIQKKSNAFELYFEDDDLEGIETKLQNEELEFIHQIIEQPWRQKVLRFYDYDKNLIEIGESMEHVAFRLYKEGKTKNEISSITYLSIEKIDAALVSYGQHYESA